MLSKIGRLVVCWSRPLQGTPKTVTISREADGWYACFSRAEVPVQPLPLTGKETGIDVGLKVFLVTADGLVVDHPRHLREAERDLHKADRRVSRRQQGSNRREKAVALRAKKHRKVQRQRQDGQHTDSALRHDLPGRCTGLQPGAQPPPRHEQRRCRLGAVPFHARLHGSLRR
jgi:putative transposase